MHHGPECPKRRSGLFGVKRSPSDRGCRLFAVSVLSMHIVELSEALRAEEKDFSFVSVDVVRLCQRPGIVTTWCVTPGIVSFVSAWERGRIRNFLGVVSWRGGLPPRFWQRAWLFCAGDAHFLRKDGQYLIRAYDASATMKIFPCVVGRDFGRKKWESPTKKDCAPLRNVPQGAQSMFFRKAGITFLQLPVRRGDRDGSL